jgi:hypothetical protein
VRAHLYADDTLVYGFCPSETPEHHNRLVAYIEDVAAWTNANRLQLNSAKTEVLWCGSRRRMLHLPSTQPLVICHNTVLPSTVVRDLSIWTDSGLTMSPHITKVVAGRYAMLRQLRGVRKSLSRDSLTSLVAALLLTRLDYCKAVLAGLSYVQLDRLQSVIRTAARLIFSARRRDHVTPMLEQLHRLPMRERIDYKLCVLVYRCLNNIAPAYLASDFQRVSGVGSRRRLRSAETAAILIPRTRTTLGDRSFLVVAARAWNALPDSVTSAPSLLTFRRLLKTHLFCRTYYHGNCEAQWPSG